VSSKTDLRAGLV